MKRLRDLLESLLIQQEQLVVAVGRSKKAMTSSNRSSHGSIDRSFNNATPASFRSVHQSTRESPTRGSSRRSKKSMDSGTDRNQPAMSAKDLAVETDNDDLASLLSYIRDYEILSESEIRFNDSMTAFS